MSELHGNSVKLVNKVSSSEQIDQLVIFSHAEIFSLVDITEQLYMKSDI